MLYAVTSAANNNGSAFAGFGRGDAVLEPAAGVLHAGRPLRRHHSGDGHRRLAGGEENSTGQPRHLATHDALFIGLLIGTVLLVGALTFIPALALGPLAEHFSLL